VKAKGGGDTYVFNVAAMDVQSFNDFFTKYTKANPYATINPLLEMRRKGARI
jgi:hypothetical protein